MYYMITWWTTRGAMMKIYTSQEKCLEHSQALHKDGSDFELGEIAWWTYEPGALHSDFPSPEPKDLRAKA